MKNSFPPQNKTFFQDDYCRKAESVITGLQWAGSYIWIELLNVFWQAQLVHMVELNRTIKSCLVSGMCLPLQTCICILTACFRELQGELPLCVLAVPSLGCTVHSQKANQVIGQGDIPLRSLWQHVNGQTGCTYCSSVEWKTLNWNMPLLFLQEVMLQGLLCFILHGCKDSEQVEPNAKEEGTRQVQVRKTGSLIW